MEDEVAPTVAKAETQAGDRAGHGVTSLTEAPPGSWEAHSGVSKLCPGDDLKAEQKPHP